MKQCKAQREPSMHVRESWGHPFATIAGEPSTLAALDCKVSYTFGDAIPFKPLNPKTPQGLQMHVLSGDMKTGPFRAIAKIPGGLKLPIHTHPASYAAVTLSGQWQKTGKGDMNADDFWTTAGTIEHQNACLSEEPCVFFIAMDGAFGMTPVEAQN